MRSELSGFDAKLARVADSRCQARMIEVVEQCDRKLPRRAKDIAKRRRGYLRMLLQMIDKVCARRLDGGLCEIKIGGNFYHLALALERRQHAAKFRDLVRAELQRFGELFEFGRLEGGFAQLILDARHQLAVAFAQLHAMRLQTEGAFLADDFGLPRESIQQASIIARTNFVP